MIINLKTFELVTEKTGEETYDYGCLMLSVDNSTLPKIDIEENDLTGDGLEIYSHATVLYGFVDDKIVVQDVLDKVAETMGPIEIDVKGISIFENEKFDVVKYDVESAQLTEMNKYFSDNFENESKFPDYHAHITIAYVKPGEGKKYIKTFEEPIKLYSTDFVYSMACGQKLKIKCKSEDVAQGYKYDNHPPSDSGLGILTTQEIQQLFDNERKKLL